MKKLFAALLVLSMLTVSVAATEFVRSLEEKPAPDVIPEAEILPDEEHKEPVIVDLGEMIITPYSERDQARTEEIKITLEKAADELTNNEVSELCPDAYEQLKAMAPDLKDEDIVVRDLFDLRMFGTMYDEFYSRNPKDAILQVTFDCNLTPEEATPVVMYKQLDSDKWVAVPADWLTRDNNDNLTVWMQYVAGPIVFLALPASIIIVDPTHESPETGDTLALSIAAAAAAVAVAGTVIAIKKKKED